MDATSSSRPASRVVRVDFGETALKVLVLRERVGGGRWRHVVEHGWRCECTGPEPLEYALLACPAHGAAAVRFVCFCRNAADAELERGLAAAAAAGRERFAIVRLSAPAESAAHTPLAGRAGAVRPAGQARTGSAGERDRPSFASTAQAPDRPAGRRGRRRWTPLEDDLVLALPEQEAAARTDRTPRAVSERRHRLRAGRPRRPEQVPEPVVVGSIRDTATAAPAPAGEISGASAPARAVGPAVRVARYTAQRFDWTPAIVALLGRVPDAAVAERTGLAPYSVFRERQRRGIPPADSRTPEIEWTPAMLARLGSDQDPRVATALGVSVAAVRRKRRALGIRSPSKGPGHSANARVWTEDELALLGTMSDRDLARRLSIAVATVADKRHRAAIPAFIGRARRVVWTAEMIAALGRLPDAEIARRARISPGTVKAKRERLGIGRAIDKRGVVVTPELLAILDRPAAEVRRLTGLKVETVRVLRQRHGIQGRDGRERWRPEDVARLGRETDGAIARDLGITDSAVRGKRRSLGIAAMPRRRRS